MEAEQIKELLQNAYHWGRDNGSNRSEKNFNDFLQTSAVKKALSEVAPKQEQEEGELSRVVGEFLKRESLERNIFMDDLYLCFDEYQNEVDIYHHVDGDNGLRYIDSKK